MKINKKVVQLTLVGLASVAIISISFYQRFQETPVAVTIPLPETSEPTPAPKVIEVNWETGGLFGERLGISDGISTVFIDSEDGKEVRAVEWISPGENPNLFVWETENGGRSWKRQGVKMMENFTPEEQKILKSNDFSRTNWRVVDWGGQEDMMQQYPTLYRSTIDWAGWDNLVEQHSTLYNWHPKAILTAKDTKNSNIVLVAVRELPNMPLVDSVSPDSPDFMNFKIRVANSHPGSYHSRLFISFDYGNIYSEIIPPAASWSTPSMEPAWKGGNVEHLMIGAISLISFEDSLKIYVGLSQWEHDSYVWQTSLKLRD